MTGCGILGSAVPTVPDPDRVLAIDPGREKCGVAVLSRKGEVLHREVVASADLDPALARLLDAWRPARVLMGDGTCPRQLRVQVEEILRGEEGGPALLLVNERHTTERARAEYWRVHPPRGLWRLVPLGLQVPREPYDDFAAVVMARDWLSSGGSSSGPPPPDHWTDADRRGIMRESQGIEE